MQQYIGLRLGAYQLVEQIGQGGMATVYKAYQPSMDRYVAVKILPRHLSEDETFLGRFHQEARTLARLEHPHILPVHDYGDQDGITYLVMRYVEAGTLKDLIARQGPLPLHEATRILEQVGRALDYAHSQGVLHRDIKPSNVLIDERGEPFLTDFGIAKLVAETARFTASGAMIGTPAYMSPEQGLGQPADHRCDIYALGVVLYELVTGRVPYEAETPLAVVLKHINDPLPLPRRLRPGLPEAVERVILKAMAKAPEHRFQSAGEMIGALHRAVAEMPTAAAVPDALAETRVAPEAGPGTAPRARPAPGPAVTSPPPSAASGGRAAAQRAPTAGAAAPAGRERPRRAVRQAPTRKAIPWLPIAGAVVALAAIIVVAVILLVDGGGAGPATPTQQPQAQTTSAVAASPGVQTPAGVPAGDEPGWTSWSNTNLTRALARQGDILWVGTESGLLQWDLPSGSYVKLDVADGLASGRINDLLLDGDGRLWVATDGGINRLENQTWTTYDEADGLDAPWVQALYLDTDGTLWAGSAYGGRGLSVFDGSGWTAPPIPPLPVDDPNVIALAGSPEWGLFVGLDDGGLAHFDGEGWFTLTTAQGLPSDWVLSLLPTQDGVWVGTDGGLGWLDLTTGAWETVVDWTIYAMLETADGALWFGGPGGAARIDPTTGDWETFEQADGSFPAWQVKDMAEDAGGLWFATAEEGALFYDGSAWQSWATDAELGGNWIEAILADRAGGLWFTHPDTGLSRYDPASDTWQTWDEDSGATDWPSNPALDSAGNVWIGTGEILLTYDGGTWAWFAPPELAEDGVWLIEIGPDDVQWLVTGSGLVRHDPAREEWTWFTGADHPILDDIWCLHVSRDGTVWVGGEVGLVAYAGGAWAAPSASGTAPEYVDDIAEAPDGSLWVAANGEVYRLAEGQWTVFRWQSEGWIERVAVAPDGGIWAGSEGLGRLDPASGTWTLFGRRHGLLHHPVEAIYVSPEGVVWVGTQGGVSRYVPERTR